MEWEETRLLIVDEISFASKDDIVKIEDKVRFLKDDPSHVYGGISVIFCGDLRQLEPCNEAERLYESPFAQFHDSVNCYIELKGMHRFRQDPEWGRLLMEFREGRLTEEHIDIINERVNRGASSLPDDVQYATFLNRDRASINVGLFDKSSASEGDDTRNAIVILSSALRVRSGDKVYKDQANAFERWFWQVCGEGDCKPDPFQGRFDPALVLYYDRPVMVNKNDDVEAGVANGSRAVVVRVCLKVGVVPAIIKLGDFNIPAVRAHQVEKIVLRHEKPNITPREFELVPQKHSFTARVPLPDTLQATRTGGSEKLKMTGVQLPIVCNNATTGHKLQGSSVDNIFVHSWTTVPNWIYVVLSRVKTIEGLFLRLPLDKRNLHKYNHVPEELNKMIQKFKKTKTTNKGVLSDADYVSILGEGRFGSLPPRPRDAP